MTPTPTPTKTDIKLDGYRIWRETRLELQEDGSATEVTRWYTSAGYLVTTQEGETWWKNDTEEITGSIQAKAESLHNDIYSLKRAKEGLA